MQHPSNHWGQALLAKGLMGLALAASFSLAGCASYSGQVAGLRKVDGLVSHVEHFHVETELASEQAHIVLESLEVLVDPGFDGDPLVAFEEFLVHLEASEKQQKRLEKSMSDMQRASVPVFEDWSKDLETFSNNTLRQHSQARFAETRRQYNEVVSAAKPAIEVFTSMNANLKDCSLFLGNDFNAMSMSAIKGQVKAINNRMIKLDKRFNACLKAALNYTQAAALPGEIQANRPGNVDSIDAQNASN